MIERKEVPCGACNACCRNQLIFIQPAEGENPSEYLTTAPRYDARFTEAACLPHPPGYDVGQPALDPTSPGWLYPLQQKPNGDCIYLDGHAGCEIYDRAPRMCRDFDCRKNLAFQKLEGFSPLRAQLWVAADNIAKLVNQALFHG